jgi:hypothetical protein
MTTKKKREKSYKREVAVALFTVFGYVVYTGNIEMAGVIVWPIFAYGMAAFGMDGYAKQIQNNTGSYSTDGDS